MSFIVMVDNEYIAEGRNYTVQGESFVPFTGRRVDAKRYRTYCGEPYDAEGYEPSHPMPCVRDEHGAIKEQAVKQLWDKVDEELVEVKSEILDHMPADSVVAYAFMQYKKDARRDAQMRVAEEIADTITALTTLADALGIDAAMRDEAQRRVNEKNRERGRL